MLMTAEFTLAAEPSVADFWSHRTGWRLNVQADGAIHSSYCDTQWLIPQLAKAIGMSDEDSRAGSAPSIRPWRCGSNRHTHSRSSTSTCGGGASTCSTARTRPSPR
jgi:hypothetical protein